MIILELFFRLPEWFRFLAIGGFNVVFANLLYISIYSVLQPYYMISAVLAHIGGVLEAFLLYKYLVYRSKGGFWHEYIKTNVTYIFALLLNLAGLQIWVEIVKIDPKIANLINSLIIAFVNYFAHKFYSFRSSST